MNKSVSVILPIWNEEKYISRCLDSILEQDYPKEKFEVLAIDGMSSDGTRKILQDYEKNGHIKIIDNPDKIIPKALNIGIKNAKGSVIVRIDAHSTYAPDYISKCVECLNKTGADNVGGVVEHRGDGFLGRAIASVQGCKFGLGGAKFRTAQKEQYVDTIFPGVWPKEVFAKFGYFNERLIRNQDIEFNSRIRKGGGKIFLTPEIKSYYYCRLNLKSLWRQNFRNGFWNIKTIKIAQDSLSLRHFVPLFFVLAILTTWVFKPLWFTIIGSYALCNLIFSLGIALKDGVKYFFIIPVVFLTLHLSYGFGLLVGVFNLICGNRL